MANTRRHFAAMFVAVLGVAQLAVAGTAYAQQRRTQPAETLLMYGVQTTPEISAYVRGVDRQVVRTRDRL